MQDIITFRWFYPMLFFTIGIITIVLICAIKSGFQFKVHVNEHINTTDKFSKAHSEIIDGIPVQYQHELHSLNLAVENNKNRIVQLAEDMNKQLDMIMERIIKLEQEKNNNFKD